MKHDIPAQTEQREQILTLADQHGLRARRDAIAAALRPGIGLRTREAQASDLAVGATRVGGEPDLALGEAWPENEDGPLHFVMQIQMQLVAPFDTEGLLPTEGLLQVFSDSYARDVRILLRAPGESLKPRPTPAHARRPAFRACGVEIVPELHLPPPGSDFVGDAGSLLELDSDEHDAYWDDVWLNWRDVQRPGPAGSCGIHQMLGYAVAERQDAQALDEVVLIGFDSDDRAHMEWGDVHCVWVFATREQLRARNFGAVRVEM